MGNALSQIDVEAEVAVEHQGGRDICLFRKAKRGVTYIDNLIPLIL